MSAFGIAVSAFALGVAVGGGMLFAFAFGLARAARRG